MYRLKYSHLSILVGLVLILSIPLTLGYSMPTVPQCPLNSSVVLMITTQPLLPSGNMIVSYGPPGPWTVVKYGDLEYLLQINMWNLASIGYGNETLTFNNATGEICFSSMIGNVTLISPSGGVWGYPGIYLVGVFPGGQVNIRNPLLPLPLTVNDLVNGSYSNRLIALNYSMWIPDDEPMDWSYDIWLTTSPAPSASLNHGAELMIWLYTTTPVFSWADTGIKVNIPVTVNGSLINETFDIHVDCYHGYDSTYWTYIAFVPLNGGFKNGYVSISLKPFLQYMVKVFPEICPSLWSSQGEVSKLWMDVITLGSEYGNNQWVNYPGWGVIAWRLYEASVLIPGLTQATSTTTTTTTVTATVTTTVTSPTLVTSTSLVTETSTLIETTSSTTTLVTTLTKLTTVTSTVTIIRQAINEAVVWVVLVIVIVVAVALVAVRRIL
ncbi:hypothetical protein [Caldivirga maquilingensis]|uniref:Glycoside hydrolase family 12 n=1 Tax=Caldivirga maquilingensis (strain ATCC 700844 / DSM 13496 / JCM 10307 / IC-167) TaxID=397948 RepID=A8MD27_CALMQ|nr:hypothetical protein [Caldivirga maquilingensis]ABW01683.1 hypothetical protein Cmaq_0848 [Caldivirga maquilingensis IC-167]